MTYKEIRDRLFELVQEYDEKIERLIGENYHSEAALLMEVRDDIFFFYDEFLADDMKDKCDA